jgi:hypothetical protein
MASRADQTLNMEPAATAAAAANSVSKCAPRKKPRAWPITGSSVEMKSAAGGSRCASKGRSTVISQSSTLAVTLSQRYAAAAAAAAAAAEAAAEAEAATELASLALEQRQHRRAAAVHSSLPGWQGATNSTNSSAIILASTTMVLAACWAAGLGSHEKTMRMHCTVLMRP